MLIFNTGFNNHNYGKDKTQFFILAMENYHRHDDRIRSLLFCAEESVIRNSGSYG